MWLKYLAGKGAEKLINEPVIIGKKQVVDSLLIDSCNSGVFSNLLFYLQIHPISKIPVIFNKYLCTFLQVTKSKAQS